ncbi:NAD-dependent protein deacetylase Sirt7 [Phlebotomus argentipes]|uniref:NAD-dependent protein deacetylase Sirt7 n=1 Tax=Phlebotomus argentipes TaxID=94469 RepID=UPI00289334AD|nr:NAD-dependent protein deacetylase Sirt7 [Phlebotomus argentipes]
MGKFEGKPYVQDNYPTRRKAAQPQEECEKKKKRDSLRKVSKILQKCETLRTAEETRLLESCKEAVKEISQRREKVQLYKERIQEKEDPPDVIETKAKRLAEAITRARHLICYTGAGISTSARIPDYRGSNGIWTLLAQGKDIGKHDLSLAEPTFTHMALYELHRRKMLRFVVSQNCDGLHLRSGLPRNSLSEVHGNMYIEACKHCKPNLEYWRLFDTTELTARYNHKTMRRCHTCGKPLVDTIVHFGERGCLRWPLNWAGACAQSEKADVILCLGSSLKVLKKYSWLWAMDRPAKKRPKLYIVNLQWTPKDNVAALKINGKCDAVMQLVMKHLNIAVPEYKRLKDPIFTHASLLNPLELHTVSQPMLKSQNELEGAEEGEEKPLEASWDDSQNALDLSSDRHSSNLSDRPEEVVVKVEPSDVKVEEDVKPESSASVPRETSEIKDEIADEEEEKEKESPKGDDEAVNSVEYDKTSRCKESSLDENSGEPRDESPETEKEERVCETVDPPEESSLSNTPLDLSCKPESPNESNITHRSPEATQSSPVVISQLPEMLAQHASGGDATACDRSSTELFGEQLLNVAKIQFSNALRNLRNFHLKSERRFHFPIGENASVDSAEQASQEVEKSPEEYYKDLLNYYKAIEGSLPYWYDTNYAYSGLHSIINPPPSDMDLWGSIFIPIFQIKGATNAECEFCFDNYGELACQFYTAWKPEFQVTARRNGKVIVCECCDYTDEEESEEEGPAKTSSVEEENSVSDEASGREEKRPKLDGETREPKIQAGWYGKGYRKNRKRKKS